MSDYGVYTASDLQKIQSLEYDVLKAIDKICSENQLEYFLDGGTALGAIRHGGFIPWDDDIDVGMTRENYKRFLEIAPNLLPKGYVLQTPYEGTRNPYFYTKVRIDGTKFMEYCNRNLNIHHGVYVDIFPYDEVPDDEALNIAQFNKVQRLIRIFTLRQTPDLSQRPTSCSRWGLAVIRRTLHYFCKVFPYKRLIRRMDHAIEMYNGTNQEALACLNHPVRKQGYIKKSDLYPLKRVKFGDGEFYVPNNHDAYLTTHYGDYMKLPPEEQRFGHKPYCVVLDREENP